MVQEKRWNHAIWCVTILATESQNNCFMSIFAQLSKATSSIRSWEKGGEVYLTSLILLHISHCSRFSMGIIVGALGAQISYTREWYSTGVKNRAVMWYEWGTKQETEMALEGNREGVQVTVCGNKLIMALKSCFCTSLPKDMFCDIHR